MCFYDDNDECNIEIFILNKLILHLYYTSCTIHQD